MSPKSFLQAVSAASCLLFIGAPASFSAEEARTAHHSQPSTFTPLLLASCSEKDCLSESDSCTDADSEPIFDLDLFRDCQQPFLTELQSLEFENCVWSGKAGMAIRYRYLHEMNRLRPGGPGLSSYDQWRVLPYASLTWNDTVTGYVEAIDASTFGEELPILPIDENRADLLQYYVDIKMLELSGGDVHFRYGRQTLLYGDQHVISPLSWANTFRNFEGYKTYFRGEEWDIDAFAVQPVNGASRGVIYNTHSFDHPDQRKWLNGVYSTYRGLNTGLLDLYWIWNVENEPIAIRQGGDRHTLGLRYYGNMEVKNCCDEVTRTWGYDLQGAFQVGSDVFTGTVIPGPSLDVSAGFFNAQLSHTWNKVDMKPQVFALYYFGSGDGNPNDNRNNTYYSLYPLGHAYWGILDNLGGQNLIDYSVGSKLQPTEKLTLTTQWHWFDKHRAQDYVYNVAGAPMGPRSTDPGGTENKNIGHELDLIATYQVNKNLTLESGYSWFWYGGAIQETTLARDNARQFYFLANYQF